SPAWNSSEEPHSVCWSPAGPPALVLDTPSGPGAGCRLDSDASVRHTRAGIQDDHWIEVELLNLGSDLGQFRNSKEDLAQCPFVGRRGATVTPQQPRAAQLVDHLARVGAAQRVQPECRVCENV